MDSNNPKREQPKVSIMDSNTPKREQSKVSSMDSNNSKKEQSLIKEHTSIYVCLGDSSIFIMVEKRGSWFSDSEHELVYDNREVFC